MATFNENFNSHLEFWIGPKDPRVRGWLLLDNYLPTFALTVLYLLIVWVGPKYMKNRPPFSCRGLLLIYNVGLTLLSLYMFWELASAAWHGSYNLYCQNTHSAPEADIKVMKALWWYYFSKLIEFMDTFFFILRKNNHQITFLHIYHHATMFNIWWFVVNWIPCGHSFFGATINSFVHIVMYLYYGLSSIPAMRPYLWWKKYLTQLQLVQFLLTVVQSSSAVIWPCGFPIRWTCFQISYMFTLIILFTNFYFQAYKKRIVSSKEHQNGSSATTGHANGTENYAHKKLRVD
ncbi:elongation of very long chain fatty acids protein 5 [Periophthalmus magnuspinnatus]|uniref:Elongation of very long chain fatty acids protein n=1 Tax=Periophthalmus magnuspinnatus TaxID=409849 RepID=A0A3B4BGN7_9GOBI|nr:elongation of very long chain fatty acids protein 5 [Periophthalmus magnuspinnatus]